MRNVFVVEYDCETDDTLSLMSVVGSKLDEARQIISDKCLGTYRGTVITTGSTADAVMRAAKWGSQ